MRSLKTVVMVPRGAEYSAVKKGIMRSRQKALPRAKTRATNNPAVNNPAIKFPQVVSLPAGPAPVRQFLRQWNGNAAAQEELGHVIVMGLCGSLVPELSVGDTVLYERCVDGDSDQGAEGVACNTDISIESNYSPSLSITPVRGVMCDRILSSAVQKRQIGCRYGAQVVDMEGLAVLHSIRHRVEKISMLRVVSDDANHDLPDLSHAFDENGKIRPFKIASQFMRQPAGAARLIRGSLIGLQTLTRVAESLANNIIRSQPS